MRRRPFVLCVVLAAAAAARAETGDAWQRAEEHLTRGERLAGAHDYEGAIAAYGQALELRPEYAEAFNDRGHAYYWKGQAAPAIADFTRAIELRPAYPNAWNNRGAAYMASGDSALAIPDFSQALRLRPDFRNAYVNRANALLRLGHVRESLADFHRAGMHPERAAMAAAGAIFLLITGCGLTLRRRTRQRAFTAPPAASGGPTG